MVKKNKKGQALFQKNFHHSGTMQKAVRFFGGVWESINSSGEKKTLFGLGFLGGMGGIMLEANNTLIRFWGKDLGIPNSIMDALPFIMMVGYLKFLWSPLLTLPWKIFKNPHGGFGLRRLWMMAMLISAALCAWMLSVESFFGPAFVATLILLAIARSTFDALAIVSQMDALGPKYWGLTESFCANGYRIGMNIFQGLALYCSAGGLGWPLIYQGFSGITLGCAIVLGVSGVLELQKRKQKKIPQDQCATDAHQTIQNSYLCLPKENSGMFFFLDVTRAENPKNYWLPLTRWITQKKAWIIVLLMVLYRGQDGMIGPMLDIFLMNQGYGKVQLSCIKPILMGASIIGGFLGGISIRHRGYLWTLWAGWMAHCAAVMLFWIWSDCLGPTGLLFPCSLERLTSGFAMIALFGFQLMCVEKTHSLTQLALLTSINQIGFLLSNGRSGYIVDTWGWNALFALSFLMQIPAAFLIKKVFSVPLVRRNIEKEF